MVPKIIILFFDERSVNNLAKVFDLITKPVKCALLLFYRLCKNGKICFIFRKV
jgi:hypothetical protein